MDYEGKILLDLGLMLVAALVGGAIFERMKLPGVIGMVLAGIFLSPFTPGYSIDVTEISFFATLGAILLMFVLGLQFDHKSLGKQGLRAFLVAGFACSITFIAGYLLGLFIGWGNSESLILGALFVPTSTTISLKLLERLKINERAHSDMLKAAIVIDDFYGFMAFAIVSGQIGLSSSSGTHVLSSAFDAVVFSLIIFVVGIKVVPKLFDLSEKFYPHSSLALGTAICLIVSYAVAIFDLSMLIGAFLAGTILTSSIRSKEVLVAIEPMRNLFGSIFFISVGLLLDPGLIAPIAAVAVLISLVAIFSKAAAFFAYFRTANLNFEDSAKLSLATGPRGEVLLIIAQSAVIAGVGGSLLLAIATSVVILTSISSPILLYLSRSKYVRQLLSPL